MEGAGPPSKQGPSPVWGLSAAAPRRERLAIQSVLERDHGRGQAGPRVREDVHLVAAALPFPFQSGSSSPTSKQNFLACLRISPWAGRLRRHARLQQLSGGS